VAEKKSKARDINIFFQMSLVMTRFGSLWA